jgi:uncharacterized membrane protein YozB (DUF420 family)
MMRRLCYCALFLTCLTPFFSGIFRGTTLALEWDWIPRLTHDEVDNLPLFIHVTGAMVYYPLAAIQMLQGVRKRYPNWHRRAGKVALYAGLASAISCTWITFVHPDARGPILYFGRVIFGPLWALFLILGILAIRRRNVPSHRDWMIRAFAVSMPAGTLVFIFLPLFLFMGHISETLDESIQSGAWFLHLGIVEYLIRKIRSKKSNRPLQEAIT